MFGCIGTTGTFAARMYVSDLSGTDEDYDRWYRSMPRSRQEKADRYKVGVAKKRCIKAFALLEYAIRDLIADTGDKISSDCAAPIPLCEDEKGKPYIEGDPFFINLSHSGQRVAAALAPCRVGCDVEQTCRDGIGIAKHFFAKEETGYLSAIGDEAGQRSEFARLWTCKESIVKCTGEGLGRELDDFSLIDANGKRVNEVKLSGQDEVYHVHTFGEYDGYCYSICSTCDCTEDNIRFVRIQDE